MAGPALGLIVNPIAGMGGSVGLKGTDTAAILSESRARGAAPKAGARAAVVLDALAAARPGLELLTAPGEMGEGIARDAGLRPTVVGAPAEGETSAADTRAAAEAMAAAGARLIVFAGGDGTARDMAAALGDRVPVIGVPAGVKMHSAVYATSPRAAAALALRALESDIDARPREVMDIDERGVPRRRRFGKALRLFVSPLCARPHPEREGWRGQQRPRGTGRNRGRNRRANGSRAALHPGARHHHAGDRRRARPAQDLARRRPGAGRGGDRRRRDRGGHSARAGGEPAPAPSSSHPSAARGTFSGAATSRSARVWCGRWASTGCSSRRRPRRSRRCMTARFTSIPAIPSLTTRFPAGAGSSLAAATRRCAGSRHDPPSLERAGGFPQDGGALPGRGVRG